jgi:pyrroloquinoline quinone (PQQ) biosynthesis protein C
MLASDLHIGKHPLPTTAHPDWMARMLAELDGPWQRAAWPRLFAETAAGRLPPLGAWRRVLTDFFVIIEGFPKYMALSLAKTTYGKRAGDARVRRWLLQNLAVEARHAEWYLDWIEALGVDVGEVVRAQPCAEVRALHEHLWQTCAERSLAEGIAAANWAIEGVTGVWSRGVAEPFRGYEADGVRVDGRSMMWLNAHARYDDAHPDEALEALKLLVDGDGGRRGDPAAVQAAARTSLELFAIAVERCYDLGRGA